jgi:hypothetical protein
MEEDALRVAVVGWTEHAAGDLVTIFGGGGGDGEFGGMRELDGGWKGGFAFDASFAVFWWSDLWGMFW